MRRLLPALGLSAALLWQPVSVFAWQTTITDAPGLPPEFVAVDKSSQRLFLLARRSPLTVEEAFPSIHGRVEGDKQVEGDLRTPEGVYFVRGKIQAQLDFDEYGSQAHALNYPNPVDRLRGKTGYGIWIHSKGRPIATQKTQGCIAIDLADIDRLAPRLKPGMPVLVAQRVDGPVLRVSGSKQAVQPSSAAVLTGTSADTQSGATPLFQTAALNGTSPHSPSEPPAAVALPAEAPVSGEMNPTIPADTSFHISVSGSAGKTGNTFNEEQNTAAVGNKEGSASSSGDAELSSGYGISADLALPSSEDDAPIPAVTEDVTEESASGRSQPARSGQMQRGMEQGMGSAFPGLFRLL